MTNELKRKKALKILLSDFDCKNEADLNEYLANEYNSISDLQSIGRVCDAMELFICADYVEDACENFYPIFSYYSLELHKRIILDEDTEFIGVTFEKLYTTLIGFNNEAKNLETSINLIK